MALANGVIERRTRTGTKLTTKSLKLDVWIYTEQSDLEHWTMATFNGNQTCGVPTAIPLFFFLPDMETPNVLHRLTRSKFYFLRLLKQDTWATPASTRPTVDGSMETKPAGYPPPVLGSSSIAIVLVSFSAGLSAGPFLGSDRQVVTARLHLLHILLSGACVSIDMRAKGGVSFASWAWLFSWIIMCSCVIQRSSLGVGAYS
jgi:hypothetical protein